MPSVDVVVATYNRHAALQRTLEGLSHQSFRDFRVIVADDGSSPPVTDALPSRFWDQLDLTVLRQENAGPAAARNNGVAAGDAPLVAFIDDDVVPDSGWLAAHIAVVRDEWTISIGPLLAPSDWKPTLWNRWEAERLALEYQRMAAHEYAPTWRQFFTGNVMLPRALLASAGPFRTDFRRAEDIELALRLRQWGGRFVFNETAAGWHYARRPLQSWLALPRQYAEYDQRLYELHPEIAVFTLVRRELGRRHPLTQRVAAVIERVPGLRPATVAVGLIASLGFNLVGARRLASRGLSLVYDLEYRAAIGPALRANEAAREAQQAGA